MKKIFSFLIILTVLFPSNLKSQSDGELVAAGVLAIGAGIAAIERVKEEMELKAVEQILFEYPEIKNFELKTSTLDGVRSKDLSSMEVVTYEITVIGGKRLVMFMFLSSGWLNQYGTDYNRIKWKLFDANEWNMLMKAYIETASRIKIKLEQVGQVDINDKGIKSGKFYALEFDKINGDMYYTYDYSDEFKVIFNEGTLALYLKQTEINTGELRKGGVRGDLVQIRRKAITKAHNFLNFK
tara:strand:- start:159 stop:878 length:720 start_codon:yes stop_codon:yes gene_type:complete